MEKEIVAGIIAAVLLYWFFKPKKRKKYQCSNCDYKTTGTHNTCPKCGCEFTFVHCTHCGYTSSKQQYSENSNKCPNCNR
jgi:rubrerythrin